MPSALHEKSGSRIAAAAFADATVLARRFLPVHAAAVLAALTWLLAALLLARLALAALLLLARLALAALLRVLPWVVLLLLLVALRLLLFIRHGRLPVIPRRS